MSHPTQTTTANAASGGEPSVVMPEDVWFKLCAKQCRERRKIYGGTRAECLDEYNCGICAECASDALDRAPAKYRTTAKEAARFDTLPGLEPHS